MIRFIDLGEQIYPGMDYEPNFAFYDTVLSRFIEIDGEAVWTRAEFRIAVAAVPATERARYNRLIPKDFGKKKNDKDTN